MASQARIKFNDNCDDIRLLGIHEELTGTAPGRRYGTEVLNKSAIVLLTAFWEAYCEDLAAEALNHLVAHASDAQALPKELRKLVARELKDHKNDLEIWKLSGEGWRQVLTRRLETLQQRRNMALNTPGPSTSINCLTTHSESRQCPRLGRGEVCQRIGHRRSSTST